MSYKINSFIASDKEVASYEKRLSICLASNGFSFSISTIHDELLAFGEVECNTAAPMSELIADIKGVMAEKRIQPFGLKEKELVLYSQQFVWVPQHLYDEKKQREYLEALCTVATGCSVNVDYNDAIKAYLVFSADNNIVSAFKIAVPGLKVRCQHSEMANPTLLVSIDMKSVLFMNVRPEETDFAVFCNKKLQISNTFSCENWDETLYHALNLTKQFHLEDAAMLTAVCGDVDRERFASLRSYFPNVALYTGRQLALTVPEMQHIPAYRHALILS